MTSPDVPGSLIVVGAALVDNLATPSLLLAARRSAPASLAGGWELPGGKVEPGETHEQALHRELAEELGITVELGRPVEGPAGPSWPLGEGGRLWVRLARITAGVAAPLADHDALRWLERSEWLSVAWLPADLPVIHALRG